MGKAHLVGSVNMSDARTVFRSAAQAMGEELSRVPDGETDRPFVTWMMPRFAAHPALELRQGELMEAVPQIAVRDDFKGTLDLGELGYAAAANRSFAIFSELKRDGTIGSRTRFQVSIPSPITVATLGHPDSQEALAEALMRATLADVDRILRDLPHAELAIQFDMPGEIGIIEGVFPSWFGTDLAPIGAQANQLGGAVPEDVEMGIHLCYGDPPPSEGERGEHWLEPKDTATLVKLANVLVESIDRRIDWLHFPVPIERDDPDYFRPLKDLQATPETELYLGLVHDEDGLEGARHRIAAAQSARSEFGVGTECGMGRVPADLVPGLLEIQGELARSLQREADRPNAKSI